MKSSINLTVLIFAIIVFNCSQEKEKILQINGTVIDMDTKSIFLIKPDQDVRYDSLIEIPVINGKFYYKERLENPEKVDVAFAESVKKGMYKIMPLFLENEKMNLTLYPEAEFDKNSIEGGKLNSQHKKFKQNFEDKFNHLLKPIEDNLHAISDNNEYYSDEMKLLQTELIKADNQDEKVVIYKKIEDLQKMGQDLSPKAKTYMDKLKPIYEEQKKFRQEYIENNPTIVSYSFLLDDLIYEKKTIDINLAKNTFETLSKANPNHPYNDLAYNLIKAIENVKIGGNYIDFSAPDLNGSIIKLSDKIKGKMVLIDLWATWCGPCIAKSRTMLPIYNEYKDKGFTIIGIAGEFKNTDRLVKFLEKEKWPWLNLVELDRENAIWQKYGVDGGGGGLFLINESGKIIAIDPTADEVKKALESRTLKVI